MPADIIIERMRLAFRAEALDLLPELDAALLALEAEPQDNELVNRVFRAVHTIKGSGATAGFAHLARFTHRVEEAFDLARSGCQPVTTALIDCGLKACDVIRALLDQTAEDQEVAGEAAVTEAVTRLLPRTLQAPPPALPSTVGSKITDSRTAYEIVFRPNRGLFCTGADPVTLLDELRQLGAAHITARTDEVPVLSSLDAESCYLWWEILLVTGRSQDDIRQVFEFVEDDCAIVIRMLADQSSAVALLGTVASESLDIFVLDSDDHLAAIEQHVLALDRDPARRESLDALFRNVHSLKGNAGLLLGEVDGAALSRNHPLHELVRVTHALESILDPFREPGAPPLTLATIQTALDTRDALRDLLDCLAHQTPSKALPANLLQRLRLESAQGVDAPAADPRQAAFMNTASQCLEVLQDCLRSLQDETASSDPVVQTYLRSLKTLAAAASYHKCRELAEPVAEQLRILEAASQLGAPLSDDDKARLSAAFHAANSAVMGNGQKRAEAPVLSSGPVLRVEEASGPEAAGDRAAAAAPTTIRIEQDKLDRLMRVVGELLVARGALPLLAQKLSDGGDGRAVGKEIKEAGARISRIAEELQNSVMSIRMLPIKTVFQRFPRLVRDLARSLGKEVNLVVEGESIEMDKTILEQIGDPLVHLVRNAVDHGLETREKRQQQGKNGTGRLTLRALKEAASVVIQVIDDGAGLDAEALKRKAIEKGALTPEAAAAMDEQAAFQLVFLPGLSTAKKLTDVSGRGVGMDVVRNNIRNLQGRIEISSQRGVGTTLTVKLPTSLMVSKGILLQAGGEEYIFPHAAIREMVKIPVEQLHRCRGTRMVQIRGEIYSVVSLAEIFGFDATKTPEAAIAVVQAGEERYALMVDRFVSEVEVIVKPLTGGLEASKEFQGAAILGDGRAVLVLNPLECHRLRPMTCP